MEDIQMAEQTVKQPMTRTLFRFLVRLQNPLMRWLLQSPLHGIVSRKYMLITVTGRKSGKQYTTPVQYGAADNKLFVLTSRDYIWWRNLRGGTAVSLQLRGKMASGEATIETETEAVAQIARRIYPTVTNAQLATILPNAVAVVIALREAATAKAG
jgi:deazaflavin-dependent oxidoreductase (nitroreductase family)